VSHDNPNPYADLDDAALCAEARRVEEPATRGPWRWWTSCSFRRLSSDATGKAGDVAHGCVHRDGQADIAIREEDMAFTEASRSLVPELTARLEKANARVRVGVAVLIRRPDGRLLLGLRKGSHGAGTWSVPGGHIDPDDANALTCARREVLEETGLPIRNVRSIGAWTLDAFPEAGKTYITLWLAADVAEDIEPVVREPAKCGGWIWASEAECPRPLFRCIENLIAQGVDPWKAGA
jgi:8-oxo-dGTP diphosphatase